MHQKEITLEIASKIASIIIRTQYVNHDWVYRLTKFRKLLQYDFFCVGVMYSGEYDACDVTLSVYPHRASLKNTPGHGGNRT
jgi:hypothetical protein